MIRLFLDTETNGLPRGNKPPNEYPEIYPLEIAAVMEDSRWPQRRQYLVGLLNWGAIDEWPEIDPGAAAVNGISKEMLLSGLHPQYTYYNLMQMIASSDEIVGHNLEFDWKIVQIWGAKLSPNELSVPGKGRYCTMLSGVELARLPSPRGGYKWPKLQELYQHLFSQQFEGAHGAMADCMAMRKCYLEMTRLGIPSTLGPFGG